jgi:cell division septation protein DedD
MKDKQISEEELLGELDTMYQRVADIEKEEAAQAPPPLKIKPKQKKKPPYRTIIIMAFVFFIVLASILTITIFDPMILLQRLKTGGTQPSTISTPPAPPKRSTVVPPPAPPKSPSVATSPAAPPSPSVAPSPAAPPSSSVAPSPAAPKRTSELPPQIKQEAVKGTQEETEKAKSEPQEIVKPIKPVPREKYYAIQIGSFREMENVHDLVGVLKKEGLDAYWITSKSRKRGTLHKVFVGQFMDTNEAARFLKDKKIFKEYPDSFIKEVSSSKVNR